MKSTHLVRLAIAIIALLTLASSAAAQGPCTSDDECPSDFFQQQFCDSGRCMPTTCTGGSSKGCQAFDKRTYCPARAGNVKCAPRLQAGQVCSWIPDFGQEQPCAPGLVCTGFVTMTCVRGGKGPVTMDGLPEHEAMAQASANEKPDDSIPPRPAGAAGRSASTIASRTSTASASTSETSSTFVNPFAPSGTGNDFTFTTRSSSSSSSASTTTLIIFSLVAVGAAVGIIAVGRVRRRRYVPRPPTGPAAPPVVPKPEAPAATHRPYGSPIEEHVEYVPVGQAKTVVEVPLDSFTPASPSSPLPYPPATTASMPVPTAYPSAYMSMPQPTAAAAAAPVSPSMYPATMPMPMPTPTPTPQPTHSPAAPTGVFVAHPDPSNVLGGPVGPTVEVQAGPGDAELVLPGRGMGMSGGMRVEVVGNKEDDELMLPGPKP